MTGPEFREWRVSEKKMTQVELSAYLGVTVKTISHWENEHTKIPKIISVLINEDEQKNRRPLGIWGV